MDQRMAKSCCLLVSRESAKNFQLSPIVSHHHHQVFARFVKVWVRLTRQVLARLARQVVARLSCIATQDLLVTTKDFLVATKRAFSVS